MSKIYFPPETLEWSEIPPKGDVPFPRCGHKAVVVGNVCEKGNVNLLCTTYSLVVFWWVSCAAGHKIYVFGGGGGKGCVRKFNDIFTFDTQTQVWEGVFHTNSIFYTSTSTILRDYVLRYIRTSVKNWLYWSLLGVDTRRHWWSSSGCLHVSITIRSRKLHFPFWRAENAGISSIE